VQSFVGKFKDEFVKRGAADEERRIVAETPAQQPGSVVSANT
jgi:hypothetical protein